MKKLILILAFICTSMAFAGGWDWFNPSTGGVAQLRTGVSFDHEAETAVHYENVRAIIKGNVEIAAALYDGQVSNMSIRTDIYDVAAVGVELTESSVRPFVQGYKDIGKFSIGGEYLFDTDTKVSQFGAELDYLLLSDLIVYAGSTVHTDNSWGPYAGVVYMLGKVDLCLGYYAVLPEADYLTSGYTFDITFNF